MNLTTGRIKTACTKTAMTNAGTRLTTMILDHIMMTSQSHLYNVLTKLETKIKEVW